MFKLQQNKVIGKSPLGNAIGRQNSVKPVDRHHQQTFDIKLEFAGNCDATVRFEIGIVPIRKHHKPMVKRAVKHMMSRVTPM